MGNELHNDYRYSQLSHYVKVIFGLGLEYRVILYLKVLLYFWSYNITP